MGLPGFVTPIQLKRTAQTGHSAVGDPVVTTSIVWTKRGHYQEEQGTHVQGDTGPIEYQVFKFWIPFLTGSDRPVITDKLIADGYEYMVTEIEQESLKHHLIVRAHRVEN
jgi:hypothetical protein